MLKEWKFVSVIICFLGILMQGPAQAADRDKLLSEPGVYGTFAAFQIDDDWRRLDQKTRQVHLNEFKGVIERHREKLAIDTYLLRGLSDQAPMLPSSPFGRMRNGGRSRTISAWS